MKYNETFHPALDDPNVFVYYRYEPSLAAAIIFVILFTIATIWHTWIMIRQKTWYFIPFVIGGTTAFLGYIGRALSAQDQWFLGPFVMQTVLLLAGPPLFSATIYMTISRIVNILKAGDLTLVKPRWITTFFVIGDVIAILGQVGGGSIMAVKDLFHTGEKVVIAGLFVQLTFFGFFVVVTGLFHHRFVKTGRAAQTTAPWLKHVTVLYISSALILIRSIFRVIEYIQGNSGYLISHEVFLYIFDATLMFLVMAMFIFVHPSEMSNGVWKVYDESSDDMETGNVDRTANMMMHDQQ